MLCNLREWLGSLPEPSKDALRVACIGNSITDGSGIFMRDLYGYPAQLQQKLGNAYVVKNFGLGRRTMLNKGDYPYMKEQAWKDVQGFCPDVVVIKFGTNDSKAFNWKYGREFATDYQAMIDTLKRLPSHPRIILATPLPALKPLGNINDSVIGNAICPQIKKLAKKNKCQLIDLHTVYQPAEGMIQNDGIHPTRKGAGQLADIVYGYIIDKNKR